MSLIDSIRNDDIDVAFEILKSGEFDPQEVDSRNGFTALHHAIEFGDDELVQALLDVEDEELRFDIELKDKKEQVSHFWDFLGFLNS